MKKILIVDDERQIIQQVRALLSEFGYSSDFVSRTELIFPKLERDSFALILLDVYMPGIDGVSLLKQLKAHSVYKNIPVIMLTGDMDDQLLSKCFEYGSTDFIHKPIKSLVLKARVKSALATNEYIRQIRQTQAQLVESEKMAALGGLVAGVAHEINTPVGVAVTAASHLETKVVEYTARYQDGNLTRGDFEAFLETVQEASQMIVSNLCRAADLIRSFKQIAVDQSNEELRCFKAKAYLEDILQSLQPKFKQTQHKITINGSEKIQLCSYPGAFSQVLTNLLMNSLIHGFDSKKTGEIIIEVSQTDAGIFFKYSDNGKGIEPEHLKKIFEPFFTTKRGQGGTGLGMHIVFNLVTITLAGKIECCSTLEKGTTFNILIPNRKI